MGFFDLNIPYDGYSPSNKATRIKLATKAMELGYSGIAYNRTMKGVMSERDRCSIPLLSLSSLLKVAPSLSASVSFHRDLLGVPKSSPFRQYTRLTVTADSVSQTQSLNSGNAILKSYDLIAVKPLNQIAFDNACEKSEVDIISIDFSDRLPFRLKLPMVKAAIRRGVYFEITYSNLIADVQVRRQMISNAKLLVDWTGGKNLIISSGSSSVNEIRGPYDVANLLSLLGISMERAKASISKSCRTVIANALKKRQFHKETIKVEPIESRKKYDTDELWSLDRQKWDPISSGNGDLIFDDSDKSSSVSKEAPKPRKAIDFASVIDSVSSHGFSVKDLLPENETVTVIPNLLDSAMDVDPSVVNEADAAASTEQEQNRITAMPMIDQISSYETVGVEETMTQIECVKDEDVILKESSFSGLASEHEVEGGTSVLDTKTEDVEILGSDDDNDLSCRPPDNPAVDGVDETIDDVGPGPPFDETQPKPSMEVPAEDSNGLYNNSVDSSAAVIEPLPGVAVDDQEQREGVAFPEKVKKARRLYQQPLAFPLKRLLDPANRQMHKRKRRRKV